MNPKRARIQISGASGTGKTTIAKRISQQFDLPYRESINRRIQEEWGVNHKTQADMQPGALWSMQKVLSAAQLENLNAPGPYVSDRSVLDGFVYALQVSGGLIDEEWLQTQIFQIVAALAGIDLLVVVPWPAPFEVPEDGFRRTLPGEQMAFHSMLLGVLSQIRGDAGIELPTIGVHFIGTRTFDLDDRVKGIIGAVIEGDVKR